MLLPVEYSNRAEHRQGVCLFSQWQLGDEFARARHFSEREQYRFGQICFITVGQHGSERWYALDCRPLHFPNRQRSGRSVGRPSLARRQQQYPSRDLNDWHGQLQRCGADKLHLPEPRGVADLVDRRTPRRHELGRRYTSQWPTASAAIYSDHHRIVLRSLSTRSVCNPRHRWHYQWNVLRHHFHRHHRNIIQLVLYRDESVRFCREF